MTADEFTSTESTVARLWGEILGVTPTSLDDDFFDLGGQSLTLVRFLQAIWDTYGVELDVAELFVTDVTVAESARAIDRATAGARTAV